MNELNKTIRYTFTALCIQRSYIQKSGGDDIVSRRTESRSQSGKQSYSLLALPDPC